MGTYKRESHAARRRELRLFCFFGLELKGESHAARWGLMRGYSGKTTKWVDFVRAGSTQRKREEPCPKEKNSEGRVGRQGVCLVCAASFRGGIWRFGCRFRLC